MSNWGGYALSAGIAIAMARGYERVLPDDQKEMELVQRIVQGRVDVTYCMKLYASSQIIIVYSWSKRWDNRTLGWQGRRYGFASVSRCPENTKKHFN